MLGLAACGPAPLEEIEAGDPLAIARLLDRAGDSYRAKLILEAYLKDEPVKTVSFARSSEEAREYLQGIERRKAKAPGGIKDALFNIKTTRYQNRINRYYFQMGICYELLGDLKKAKENYDRSIELRPKLSVVFVRRGLLRERLGNLKGARADFIRSVQVQAAYPPAHFQRGMFLARRGETKSALKEADFLQKVRPDYALLIRKTAEKQNQGDLL